MSLRLDWRSPPSWLLGLLLAILTWSVALAPPSIGLDGSWIAGISMATHEGLHYGTEFVFSYGPLGFLALPLIFYSGFGVLSLLFLSLIYISLCVALIAMLRRQLPAWFSLVLGVGLLGLLPLIEQPLVLATLASIALLEKERPQWSVNLFVVCGAGFAAVEALTKLSTGPAVLAVIFLAVVGARPRRYQVALFVGLVVAELAALWFGTGQTLGNVGPFIGNTIQVAGAYSTAMMRVVDVPSWQVTLATIAAAGLSLTIAVATFLLPFRDRRARNFATAAVAIAIYAIYKEGVVRPDAGHLSLYFSSACILWIGLPWQRGRWLLAGAVAIALVGIPMRPTGMPTNYHLFDNVKLAGEEVGTLFSPSERAELIHIGRVGSKGTYRLEPKIKAALEGHTVSVEPWETNVVWAYEMDWKPVPIFQNYSAYTSHLDRLNSEAIEAPDGPERILRENPPFVFPEFETADLDGRFFGWDPPEQARAVLCHYAPVQVNLRWEVLSRTADRCGAPRPVGSVAASYGQTIDIPTPGPGEVIFVRIHGAGVSGVEKLTNLLLHARTRHAILNETTSYRLIPETATDGLLMAGDPALVAEEGSYSPIPNAQTIKLEGASGNLTFDFFAMKVAPGTTP